MNIPLPFDSDAYARQQWLRDRINARIAGGVRPRVQEPRRPSLVESVEKIILSRTAGGFELRRQLWAMLCDEFLDDLIELVRGVVEGMQPKRRKRIAK